MVFVGKFTGPGRFPDCRVVPVYDQCHPVYRFHTHGHSGSTGTCDGHILWGDRIREMLTLRESIGLVMIVTAVTFVIAGSNITLYLIRFRKLFPRLSVGGRKRAGSKEPLSR